MSELEIYSYISPAAEGQTLDDIERNMSAVTGLDRSLIGYHSFGPDGLVLAGLTLSANRDLNVLVAQRPGVMAPPVAARAVSTVSRVSGGRVDLHMISGGAPGDQLREGDYLGHDERYLRAGEYVDALRAIWAAERPVSYEGAYYKFEDIRPNEMQARDVRIHMGGVSPAALEFGASKADVYMLWGEPFSEVAARINEIEEKAASYGRPRPRISLSLRLYLGETDEAAWKRARNEPVYLAFVAKGGEVSNRQHAEDVDRNRQLKVAQAGEQHDDCL
jgi:alkanesulfonate monooxygenase